MAFLASHFLCLLHFLAQTGRHYMPGLLLCKALDVATLLPLYSLRPHKVGFFFPNTFPMRLHLAYSISIQTSSSSSSTPIFSDIERENVLNFFSTSDSILVQAPSTVDTPELNVRPVDSQAKPKIKEYSSILC